MHSQISLGTHQPHNARTLLAQQACHMHWHWHTLENMNTRLMPCLLILLAIPTLAMAQWQWLDKEGRPVFSDMPPPSGVSDKQIVKRPEAKLTASQGSTAVQPPVTSSAEKPLTPEVNTEDAALSAKIAQTKQAEMQKQQAEEARLATIKAENCRRARSALNTLNSGTRMRITNAQGESVIMDDAARQAEAQHLQNVMHADCQ